MKCKLLFLVVFIVLALEAFSQAGSYNDGPITIDVKLREVQGNFAATDEALLGIGFAPDELSFKIWSKDNLGIYPWTGGNCYQDLNFTPTLSGTNSIDFNTTFATFNYSTVNVPQFLELKIDAWEDDLPSDNLLGFCNTGTACEWNDIECCGVWVPPVYLFGVLITPGFCLGLETGDDYRCSAEPFFTGLDYRNGPPCEWYSHGNINGSGCVNTTSQSNPVSTDGYYKPHIETYWRYTKGNSFTNAIDLGNITTGVISHFNSNECYTNYYNASSGNDVIYSFTVNNPTGVNISLCGTNGAQFDSYLYLLNDTNAAPLALNDDACNDQSEIITSLCDVGVYYIVVDAVSASEIGTFTLTLIEDVNNAFDLNISKTNITCNGYDDGIINISVSGGSAPYTFSWYDDNMNLLQTPVLSTSSIDSIFSLSPGNYFAQVLDDNGCLILDTIEIYEPLPININLSSTNASCYGFSDASATVSVSGGVPGYTYAWNTNPIQNNSTAIYLSSGFHTVLITDQNNCTSMDSIYVNEPLPVPVDISSNSNIVCEGGNLVLNGSGGISYSWSPSIWLNSSTASSVVTTPSSSISYILTATDIYGCSNNDTIDIIVTPSISLSANLISPTICYGESVNININGATTYSWFPINGLNITSQGQAILSPNTTTNYQVIGTNNSGCVDTININVNVLSQPTVSINNSSIICEGESISLFANGANTYYWYPNTALNNNIGSTVVASPNSSVNYYVVGTDVNGCRDTAYTSISVNPSPSISLFPSQLELCEGDTGTVYLYSNLSYNWYPNTNIDDFLVDTVFLYPSNNTTFNIIAMDSLGCSSEINYDVSISPNPILNILSSSNSICLGDNTMLSVSGASSYTWYPSNTLDINIGDTVFASPISNTTYSVVGIDNNNCSSNSSIMVDVNPLPVLSVSPLISTICEDSTIQLSVTGANSYLWSPQIGLNTNTSSSVMASPIVSVNYSVTGTDMNGCSSVISTQVNVNSKPNVFTIPNVANICEGATIDIDAYGALSYTWEPSIGLSSNNSSNVTANPVSSTNYSIIGTDLNGCTASTSLQLNVGISPSVNVSPSNSTICAGESIMLSADGAIQYSWNPNNTLNSNFGSSVLASPTNSTLYTVIGVDSIGCSDTSYSAINVSSLPTASIPSNNGMSVCAGDSILLPLDVSGSPPYIISYSVNNSLQDIVVSSNNPAIISSNLPGNYIINTITDNTGCVNTGNGSLFVQLINKPIADFVFLDNEVDILDPQIKLVNNSFFADTWFWDFGDGFSNSEDYNPTHTYQEIGDYQVTLITENQSCTDTIKRIITIDPVYTLYVPDVFTPNNDGLNDLFLVKGVGVLDFKMKIYNRWGELIFYTQNINEGWDGKVNNSDPVAAYYSYIIDIIDFNNIQHTLKGDILLN